MVPIFQKNKNLNSSSQERKLEKVIATIFAEFCLFPLFTKILHIPKTVGLVQFFLTFSQHFVKIVKLTMSLFVSGLPERGLCLPYSG